MQAGGPSDEVGPKERGFPCLLVWLGSKEKGETVYSPTTKSALGDADVSLDQLRRQPQAPAVLHRAHPASFFFGRFSL